LHIISTLLCLVMAEGAFDDLPCFGEALTPDNPLVGLITGRSWTGRPFARPVEKV